MDNDREHRNIDREELSISRPGTHKKSASKMDPPPEEKVLASDGGWDHGKPAGSALQASEQHAAAGRLSAGVFVSGFSWYNPLCSGWNKSETKDHERGATVRFHRCELCHIDLKHVGVRRGGLEVLSDINMHIHCGQLTVLIGQNGAGKTTLVRALLGEIPYTGTIRHEDGHGRVLGHLRIGYVPQHLAFDADMPATVEDFMASALSRRPVRTGIGKKTREKILKALSVVQGEDLLKRPLGRCSGGELQRVLLALALQPSPDLLLLDEPVSGMDQNGLKLFLDMVRTLKEGRHMAILLVSHDLHLVREYADHVVLLEKTVLIQGAPDPVFESEAFERVFGNREEGNACRASIN